MTAGSTTGDSCSGADADPTDQGVWTPLRDLLNAMDADIARLYVERGATGVRPRFVQALIKLGRHEPMTIRELAEYTQHTHSAMSQTVSVLRRDGLVRSAPGTDARTRKVALTERARELVPLLEAEWRATEAAVADLEAEIPYPLTQVVRDIEAALARRSFHDRIAAKLAGIEDESYS